MKLKYSLPAFLFLAINLTASATPTIRSCQSTIKLASVSESHAATANVIVMETQGSSPACDVTSCGSGGYAYIDFQDKMLYAAVLRLMPAVTDSTYSSSRSVFLQFETENTSKGIPSLTGWTTPCKLITVF